MNSALAGLVILVIGDSQMMNMMNNLHNQLGTAGAAVHTYAMCGATPGDWVYRSTVSSCGRAEHHEKNPVITENKPQLPTYVLSDLIEKHHPNLIVVEMGDTVAGYGMPQINRPWLIEQVRTLTGKIAASRISCNWVGPMWGQNEPPYNKSDTRVKEVSQLLSESVSPCRYIDPPLLPGPASCPPETARISSRTATGNGQPRLQMRSCD